DLRSGNYDIYSQRINASGAVQWTTDGISLCVATGNQLDPQITSDGASGAIVTWIDGRSGLYSIYAQRINASGTVQWTADGVPICTATGGQTDPRIIPDGAGGAIITWNDGRSSNYDIYAQVVDSKGRAGYFPPVITSIIDLPDDEGGYVRITVEKSSYDQEGWYTHPASFYNVWRRVGDPALLASIKEGKRGDAAAEIMPGSLPDRSIDPANFEGWPIIELAGRSFLESKELLPAAEFPPGTWEILGSFAACQQEEYLYIASTLTDSTASGIPLSVYMVSVHTTIPSIWFMSEPDSGYSVDNLAPAVPVGLAGAAAEGPPGIVLEWDQNTENDISHYIVYRGTHAGFIPSEPSELGETYSTDFIDEYMLWHESYYKICAVDRHGNESDFALLGPAEITGEETPDTPAAAYLSQNYPNPFNPSTTIEFGLAEASPVSLNIYDAAGRLVRVIIDETLPAAHYSEVWDGKDGSGKAVASGVYFYRLNTKTFSENRKMILLR
ncbi:MAG: T9SS type A sorting domain-containing protein, partial [Candidatus Krumholzibacteria bacterium]|nr:T9SS type A sorting domain-containing protein [Candidatus Krumholzibacteria bacterium]